MPPRRPSRRTAQDTWGTAKDSVLGKAEQSKESIKENAETVKKIMNTKNSWWWWTDDDSFSLSLSLSLFPVDLSCTRNNMFWLWLSSFNLGIYCSFVTCTCTHGMQVVHALPRTRCKMKYFISFHRGWCRSDGGIQYILHVFLYITVPYPVKIKQENHGSLIVESVISHHISINRGDT